METKEPDLFSTFVNKNYNTIKTVERYSIAIFLLGLIAYMLKMPYARSILIVGSALATITFLMQTKKVFIFEDIESLNILGSRRFINFIYKIYYFAIAISVFAMLGFVFELKNKFMFLMNGALFLLIILILVFFSKIKNKNLVYDFDFYIKLLVCLGILMYLAIFNLS